MMTAAKIDHFQALQPYVARKTCSVKPFSDENMLSRQTWITIDSTIRNAASHTGKSNDPVFLRHRKCCVVDIDVDATSTLIASNQKLRRVKTILPSSRRNEASFRPPYLGFCHANTQKCKICIHRSGI
jgi:hypothetical protein